MFNIFKPKPKKVVILPKFSRVRTLQILMEAAEVGDRYTSILLNQRRIKHKFFNGLLDIANAECIDIEWHTCEDKMNLAYFGKDGVLPQGFKKAAGIYQYTHRGGVVLNNRTEKRPTIAIHVNKDKVDTVWVLAHEIGHHFAIHINNDFSESGADAMIKTLAELILTPLEIFILEFAIEIYSGTRDRSISEDVSISIHCDRLRTVKNRIGKNIMIKWIEKNYPGCLQAITKYKYNDILDI